MARRYRRKGPKTYVELEGVGDIQRAFARLETGVLIGVKGVIADSAATIEAEAKARCPVAEPSTKGQNAPPPGTTRNSIKTIFRDFGLSASIGSGWFVFRFLEHGVKGRPARPMLNPAFQAERPGYLAGIEAAVGKAGREASVS